MSKQVQITIIILAIIVVLALGTIAYLKFSTEDSWLCQNGQWIRHGNPSDSMPTTGCGEVINNNVNDNNINSVPPLENSNLIIDFPKANDELTSPATITGSARTWYFEASFPVKLLDENGKEIAIVPAQAQGDWMTDQFVPFNATLEFLVDKDQNGTLVLMKDNPSGLAAYDEKVEIPVKLKGVETMSVKVFFGSETKNPGALDCTKVFAVDRLIPKTQTTAEAALGELLKGPTQAEIDQKYFTSINSGVKLQKITIKDGTAYADFDKTLEFQVGGSCRVAAIASQITETLKQFSAINNVVISIDGRTEDILQP